MKYIKVELEDCIWEKEANVDIMSTFLREDVVIVTVCQSRVDLLKDPVVNLLSSCYSYRDTRSYISALYILQCSINDMVALKRQPSHSHFFVSPLPFFSFPFRGSQEKSHFPSLRRNRPAFSPLTSIAKNNVTR